MKNNIFINGKRCTCFDDVKTSNKNITIDGQNNVFVDNSINSSDDDVAEELKKKMEKLKKKLKILDDLNEEGWW